MRLNVSSWTSRDARQALSLGAALTTLHVALAIWLAPGQDLQRSYERLCAWDCAWYESIASEGYRSPVPPVPQQKWVSNVAFFPAYPVLGGIAHRATGVPTKVALLGVAQVFSVLFWAALWLLLKRMEVPSRTARGVVMAVFAHPASFFLVSGYSESMFLASLLVLILYSRGPGERAGWLGVAGGFLMSATRVVGIAAAGYPLVCQASKLLIDPPGTARGRALARPFALSLGASMGGLAFLGYCELRFGAHDLYMQTQRIGWGIVPDYWAIFKWSEFSYRFLIDRVATIVSGLGFVAVIVAESLCWKRLRGHGLSERLPLYLTAFLIFFVTLSGLKSVGFASMIRYSFPWFVLLAVACAHLFSRLTSVPKAVAAICSGGIAAASWISLFLIQIPHLKEFLRGRWFA